MKNKDINKDLKVSDEVEEIKLIEQEELLSKLANKLNKDQSKILEELAYIIKGQIND